MEFFDLRVDSAVARRLHRLLGIPEQRSRKIREEVKSLRKELATSESASRAASFLTRTFLALSGHGGEYDAQGWREVHVRAERVQSYLARFRPMSLWRGASAMVGDVIACCARAARGGDLRGVPRAGPGRDTGAAASP